MKKILFGVALVLLLADSPAFAGLGAVHAQKSLVLNTDCLVLPVENLDINTATFWLSGTWSGVVTTSATTDPAGAAGSYATIKVTQAGKPTKAVTITANGQYRSDVSGFRFIKACFTTATSGTVVVDIYALSGTGNFAANETTNVQLAEVAACGASPCSVPGASTAILNANPDRHSACFQDTGTAASATIYCTTDGRTASATVHNFVLGGPGNTTGWPTSYCISGGSTIWGGAVACFGGASAQLDLHVY